MFSVSTSDPFWKRKKYTNELNDVFFYSFIENTFPSQNVRINMTYNFGKMDLQVKKARRGINNDDLKSGSSSQGGANSTQPQ